MSLITDLNWKKDSLGYSEFVEPIVSVVERIGEVIIKHYNDINVKDLCRCSRIILSGTTLKDRRAIQEPEKFSWLKQTDKPVLGICAGMEIIGQVFNMQIVSGLEIGMTQITTLKDNTLFSGIFKAYSLHKYAVKPSADFEVLAKSAQCVQAIKHKTKPIYGVLFHPEVRNVDILKRFVTLN